MRRLDTGPLAIILAAGSWGTIGVAVTALYRVDVTDPWSVGFWRLALSALPLLALSRVSTGPTFWRVQRRDVPPLLLMGAGFASYQVCYFAAIPLIGLAAAVLINIGSAPIITALLASILLGERFTRQVGLALAGALLGAVLLVGAAPEAGSAAELAAGAALALGAGFCYSLVALTGRVVAPRYHPVQPIAMVFTGSTLLLLAVVLARGLDLNYPAVGWGLLLYLGLVPTALGYGLYLRGLQTVSATASAVLALLEPLISAVCAVTLLGERLVPASAAGGLLLLGSVVFLCVRQSRQARDRVPAPEAP
ncbi:MAG: DMT family transporter [Anaerolineales bacterium]|nr:DMT family transporter [Anaerolineales bacterium]